MSSASQEFMSGQDQEISSEESRETALEGYGKVDWSSYARSGVLSSSEVDLIKSGEETPLEYTLKDEGLAPKYAQALLKVVSSVNEKAALRYVLTRMEDVLVEEECGLSLKQRVYLFFSDTTDVHGVRDTFLRSLQQIQDGYTSKTSASILATLLTAYEAKENELFEPFILWLCDQLSSSRSAKKTEVKAAVPALTILLRSTVARSLFADHGGVGYATKLLRRTAASVAASTSQQSSQMVYELTFCLWTLSLEWSNCQRIVQDFHAHATIEALVDQVASAPREKVIRVSLATLRNLSTSTILSNSQGVAAKMIKAGLVKNLRTLRERPWTDPDVKEDVEYLSKVLSANYRELSTFERYLAEVDSGELDWGSLCHSEAFWKDNAKFAEANDFSLIKKLVTIVSQASQTDSNDDPDMNKNIAIACSDLGDFVRFYPNGKAVIKHLGAKNSIMKLIDHPDPDVQRHALQCVSKLLVTNWQFVKS